MTCWLAAGNRPGSTAIEHRPSTSSWMDVSSNAIDDSASCIVPAIHSGNECSNVKQKSENKYKLITAYIKILHDTTFGFVKCAHYSALFQISSNRPISRAFVYSALWWVWYSSLKRSDTVLFKEGSHSFIRHPHAYPRMVWAILHLLHSRRASSHSGRYSFPVRWG